MLPIQFPTVTILAATNLNPHYRHGIAISLLRGLAAIEVAAAHVRAQMYPSLKSLPDPTLYYQALSFATGFAHQAVVVFFLLSGWLVGGSLLNKLHQPDALAGYAIDRLTRLWIVLVPAFGLTLMLALHAGVADPRRFDFSADNPLSLTVFGANLVGLQDMLGPRYGGNFALWSLAYEWWYYVLFPLAVLAWRAHRPAHRGAAALTGAMLMWLLDSAIVLYFTLWLLGVAFSRIRIEAGAGWFALLAGMLVTLSVLFRLTGSNDILTEESYAQDLAFSCAFLLVLCCLQAPANLGHRWTRIAAWSGDQLAAFSFTLYVIHVPLLLAMRQSIAPALADGKLAPDRPAHLIVYAGMLAMLVLLAWLFHLPFEAQTGRLRRLIHSLRTSRRRRVKVAA